MSRFSFLIPFLIWIVIPLLSLGLLQFSRWKRHRRGERPPFRDLLLRSPGESLRREIQDMSDDVVWYLVLMYSLPLLVYSMYLAISNSGEPSTGAHIFFLLVLLGAVIFPVYKTSRIIAKRRHLRLGLAGEIAVGEELNRLMLDGYRVYHDFPAERFNIDHIIVSQVGVFAVETKARSKKGMGKAKSEAEVVYDGKQLRFPSWVTAEPTDQAKDQAKWLSNWLSNAVGETVRTTPIVIIPGWFINRKAPDSVPVLNPKEVMAYFASKKESVLFETMIQRICHQVEQKCRDVDLWEWY
jgi:hypothetical protein